MPALHATTPCVHIARTMPGGSACMHACQEARQEMVCTANAGADDDIVGGVVAP